MQAERRWYCSPPEERELLDLTDQLTSADEYFKKAESRDIGDIDLRKRKNRPNELARVYARAGAKAAVRCPPDPGEPKASSD